MKPKDVAALVLLAAIWGGSFLFIRVAVPALGPIVVAFLRVVVAGLALIAYIALAGRSVALRADFRGFLILGLFNAAIPYSLIAAAELHITASLAAILNATTPLFTAVCASIWMGERLTPKMAAGLVLGMVGVGIVVGWSSFSIDLALILATLAVLAASLSYGLASTYAKIALKGRPSLTLAIGQQIGGSILLLPVLVPGVVLHDVDVTPSAKVAGSILGLAVLCTSAAYILYFFLISSVGPTKTLSVTFLVPVFGIVWSRIFLDESIALSAVLGLLVVLASVFLVTDLRLPISRSFRPSIASFREPEPKSHGPTAD